MWLGGQMRHAFLGSTVFERLSAVAAFDTTSWAVSCRDAMYVLHTEGMQKTKLHDSPEGYRFGTVLPLSESGRIVVDIDSAARCCVGLADKSPNSLRQWQVPLQWISQASVDDSESLLCVSGVADVLLRPGYLFDGTSVVINMETDECASIPSGACTFFEKFFYYTYGRSIYQVPSQEVRTTSASLWLQPSLRQQVAFERELRLIVSHDRVLLATQYGLFAAPDFRPICQWKLVELVCGTVEMLCVAGIGHDVILVNPATSQMQEIAAKSPSHVIAIDSVIVERDERKVRGIVAVARHLGELELHQIEVDLQ